MLPTTENQSADSFLTELEKDFEAAAHTENAEQMTAYMKNNFEFYGLKSPLRKQIQRPYLLKKTLPPKDVAIEILLKTWEKPQREWQYFGCEFIAKYKKELAPEDLNWIQHIITHKSWWDSVDFISSHLLGAYFGQFPERIMPTIEEWAKTDHLWLHRSLLLFQLKYKKQTQTDILENVILLWIDRKEFFIRKAIGWVLREYAKTDSKWVIDFVNKYKDRLSPLSKKEALKHLTNF